MNDDRRHAGAPLSGNGSDGQLRLMQARSERRSLLDLPEPQPNQLALPGVLEAAKSSGAAGPTFHHLAEEWFELERRRLVEPVNERRHIAHLRQLWALREGELRPRAVRAALLELLAPTGTLGAATVNKVQSTGRRIIREAQLNERWLGPNPFEIVPRLRQVKPSFRTLSLAECRTLLPYLREDRRREVLVMLYLGCRPGEIKALKKQDVDLTRSELVIKRSNGRDQTKTGKERRVPISEGLRAVLADALWATSEDCDLVFPGQEGRRQRSDIKLARMLRSAMGRAGLVTGYSYVCRRSGCGHREKRRWEEDVRCPTCRAKLWVTGIALPVRYYDLRHSAATLHREAGCDPLVIQYTLGHAPKNLTDSIYTHLSADYLRRELNKLRI